MATVTKKQYEGMFLVDTALAASDWDGTIKTIENILKKFGAEIISTRKWDERRLAYDIQKKSRGTYILTYFKCDGPRIQEIEKSVHLSEQIIRVLILNADHMTQEDMEKETPANKADRMPEEQREEVDRRDEEPDYEVPGEEDYEEIDEDESVDDIDDSEDIKSSQ